MLSAEEGGTGRDTCFRCVGEVGVDLRVVVHLLTSFLEGEGAMGDNTLNAGTKIPERLLGKKQE